jgi:hypothetical protein
MVTFPFTNWLKRERPETAEMPTPRDTFLASGSTRSARELSLWRTLSSISYLYFAVLYFQNSSKTNKLSNPDFIETHVGLIVLGIVIQLFPRLYREIFGRLPFASLRVAIQEYRYKRRERNEIEQQSSLSELPDLTVNERISVPAIASNLDAITLDAEATIISEDIDKLDPRQTLLHYATKSDQLCRRIFTRSGVYLMTGVILAGVGLAFFWYRTNNLPETTDLLQKFSNLVPGFGILFFIEFVALFFLRQYRSAMDEFRYFEAVKRRREESLVILKMFEENTEIVATTDVIRARNIYSDAGKLGKDETTEMLEARRLQDDEIVVVEKFIDAMSTLRDQKKDNEKTRHSRG